MPTQTFEWEPKCQMGSRLVNINMPGLGSTMIAVVHQQLLIYMTRL